MVENFDIVFLTPYFEDRGGMPRTTRSTCVGLSQMKAYLNQDGLTSKIIDPYGLRLELEPTMKLLNLYDSDIYAISGTFLTDKSMKSLSEEIKKKNPDSTLILGGWSSFSYQEILLDVPEIDYIVVGPGLLAISPLVRAIKENKDISNIPGVAYRNEKKNRPGDIIGAPVFTGVAEKVEHPDDVLLPDFSDTPPFRIDKRGAPLSINYYSSWGCPYDTCKFCTIGLMYGNYQEMSPEKVVDDWARFFDRWPGIELISLSDDCFDIKRLEKIIPLAEKKIGKEFMLLWQTAAANVCRNEELYLDPELQKYIFRFDIGIETFSTERLKMMHKPSNPDMNWHAVEIAAKTGKDYLCYTILDAKLEELQDTKHLYTDEKFWPANIWMNFLVVHPYTKFDRESHKELIRPWQWAFSKVHKPFHDLRHRFVEARDFSKPSDTKNARLSEDKIEYFKQKKQKLWAGLNHLVTDHFEKSLEIAKQVDQKKLHPKSIKIDATALKYKKQLEKGLERLWHEYSKRD